MNHRWDHNQQTGLSTCQHCGSTVKTYRVKHGGITPCNPTAPPKPPCTTKTPPLACTTCPARLDEKKCDQTRTYYVAKPPTPSRVD